MRVAGALAALTYRLSRHRFLRLPLDVAIAGATGLLLVYGAAGLFLGRSWPASPWLAGGLALWSAISLSLRARSFVLFQRSEAQVGGEGALVPFEKLPLHATGVFEVGGERRYYVQTAGTIEATELGERIVMAKVRPVSIIGLLGSPSEEWGCWYTFFRPEDLTAAVPGRFYFGRRAWSALRLSFQGRTPPLILSFADPEMRDLVVADLHSASFS